MLFAETVPAPESPFNQIDASRITLRQEATIEYTRTTKVTELDEFDLSLGMVDAQAMVEPQALTPLSGFVPCAPPLIIRSYSVRPGRPRHSLRGRPDRSDRAVPLASRSLEVDSILPITVCHCLLHSLRFDLD